MYKIQVFCLTRNLTKSRTEAFFLFELSLLYGISEKKEKVKTQVLTTYEVFIILVKTFQSVNTNTNVSNATKVMPLLQYMQRMAA